MSEITVTQLRSTSTFPQEWEGMTDEGHFVHIQYARGELTFGCGITKEDARSGNRLEYTALLGDEGHLETEQMKGILGPLIRFDV